MYKGRCKSGSQCKCICHFDLFLIYISALPYLPVFRSAIESGKILIPQIEVVPTDVVANPDHPPELEIRFDMEPAIPNFDDPEAELPVNWQLRFIHNQLFKHFLFPSRFCPGPFHSTILRKADWRSPEHKEMYFAKCDRAIQKWKAEGPKPLNTGWNIDGSELEDKPEYCSGIWLFVDRENITHHFAPNFLPPYNTPEKRKVILDFLREEWDDKDLRWKPVGKDGGARSILDFVCEKVCGTASADKDA